MLWRVIFEFVCGGVIEVMVIGGCFRFEFLRGNLW